MRSVEQIVRFLSGGNQQKVLVAKSIARDPHVFIAMDPTRGIDVGAKADIHRILHELTNKGMSIIMISSELDELINMCDRIIVMNFGEINKVFQEKRFRHRKNSISNASIRRSRSVEDEPTQKSLKPTLTIS